MGRESSAVAFSVHGHGYVLVCARLRCVAAVHVTSTLSRQAMTVGVEEIH